MADLASELAAQRLSVALPTLDATSIQLEGFVTGVKLNDKGAAITFVTAPTASLVEAMGLLIAIQITGEPVGLAIDRRQMGLDFEKPEKEPEGDGEG